MFKELNVYKDDEIISTIGIYLDNIVTIQVANKTEQDIFDKKVSIGLLINGNFISLFEISSIDEDSIDIIKKHAEKVNKIYDEITSYLK